MTVFLFRAKARGGHVHVGVWAGTQKQADAMARPKLGDLVMDAEQWSHLRCFLAGSSAIDIEDEGTGR